MQYGEHYLYDGHGAPILKAYLSKVPPTVRNFRKHHHSECEISAVLSGTGIYTTEDSEYSFCNGSVFLFRGDEVHCITRTNTDLTLLNIRFMPTFLISEGGDINLLKILYSRNANFRNHIDFDNVHTRIIHQNLRNIYTELSEGKDGFSVMVRCILYSVFVSLIRDYDYVDISAPYSDCKNNTDAIGDAIRYINDNLDKPLTLSDIAAEAAMSPSYFSTAFKKINGMPPWRYITIKRIEKSIELLKTTNLTKIDIAFKCGFSSSSNFYKAFKSITGKLPSDYKPTDI